MVDIPGLPEGSISRVLVLTDLGNVRKGDHLIVVGGQYVISVDTSRQPGDPVFVQRSKADPFPPAPTVSPAPNMSKGRPPGVKAKTERFVITAEKIVARIREAGETTARQIGDDLGIPRADVSNRARITRFLQILRQDGKVRIIHQNGNFVVYGAIQSPADSNEASSAPLDQRA